MRKSLRLWSGESDEIEVRDEVDRDDGEGIQRDDDE